MTGQQPAKAVTGAFGFTGRHIAMRLLSRGEHVVTLTNHPDPEDEIARRLDVYPLDFDDPSRLEKSLHGVEVLYNTYWIRFPRGSLTFDKAVRNTRVLLEAARNAGVRKIVHISISNPSLDSDLPYFRGKAQVEQAITESGLDYAVVRPTVIFGDKGLLINNMAWLLRRFPVFPVPGDGLYRIQAVHADDVADLAITMAAADDCAVMDAVGPEVYTFNDLLLLLRRATQSKCRLVQVNPSLAYQLSRLPSLLLRDVLITRDEIRGLMDDLLVSSGPPTGTTRLSEWIEANAGWLGQRYISELGKHYGQ